MFEMLKTLQFCVKGGIRLLLIVPDGAKVNAIGEAVPAVDQMSMADVCNCWVAAAHICCTATLYNIPGAWLLPLLCYTLQELGRLCSCDYVVPGHMCDIHMCCSHAGLVSAGTVSILIWVVFTCITVNQTDCTCS